MRHALVVSTNGVGLGHLTRSLAVARRLPPDVHPRVFTFSRAVALARGLGFYAEHIAERRYVRSPRAWDRAMPLKFRAVLRECDPDVVFYDGATLPDGLADALEPERRPLVWMRRGLQKAGGQWPTAAAARCHAVIEPRDLAASAPDAAAATSVEPVVLTEAEDVLPRSEAAAVVGAPVGAINVLIQLGAIHDEAVRAALTVCADLAAADDAISVWVALSPLAEPPADLPTGIAVVRRYPLGPVLRAFDAVISACGYNSFHEIVAFGIPAVLVPNPNTARDDQVARARFAEQHGLALTWYAGDPEQLRVAVRAVLEPATAAGLAQACRAHAFANGAVTAASLVAGAATGATVG